MDRDEAYKLLGLYVGATNEQIQSKFDSMNAELRAELAAGTSHAGNDVQAKLDQLRLAYHTAMSDDNSAASLISPATRVIEPPAPPAPAKGKRGSLVVLFMAVTMVLIASTSFGGIWYLDKQRDIKQAKREQAGAHAAQDAWEKYRAAQGLPQTTDGLRADEALALAERTLDEGYAEEAGEDFKTVQELYITTLKAENARLATAWDTEVVTIWKQRLKDRFPFNRDSETDVDMGDVNALFQPRNGAVWRISASYDALGDITIMDRQYATVPAKLRETVESAKVIRDALYGEDATTVDVPFSIKLTGKIPLLVIELDTGGATVSTRDENFTLARWTLKQSGARLAPKKVGDRPSKQPEIDFSESSWGLLHLLSYGDYKGEVDGSHLWHFEVTGEGTRGRTLEGDVRIQLLGKNNPFDFATYSGFSAE